jgi:hypothetical protein
MKRELVKGSREIPKVEFGSLGVGTLRTSTSYIVLLLNLEDPGDRADIIASAMEQMGISLEDVADYFDTTICPKCQVHLARVCRGYGRCP